VDTGFSWLRIGTVGGFSWTWLWTLFIPSHALIHFKISTHVKI